MTIPPYETKDMAKNILVLAGYLLVLPEEKIKKLFSTAAAWGRFWTNFMCLGIKRFLFGFLTPCNESETLLLDYQQLLL